MLDAPRASDVDLVTEYCQDPLFEKFVTTPWPYRRSDAETFVEKLVPSWWEAETEFTWALREAAGGPLLGVVGYRIAANDIGFWIGAPHRGRGYMTEAVGAVLDWVFERTSSPVLWEAVIGNAASASVARKAGFTFAGEATSQFTDRDGTHPRVWTATIAKDAPRPSTGSGTAFKSWPA